MMVPIRLLVVLGAAMVVSDRHAGAPAPARPSGATPTCDGKPPELVNKDSLPHDVTLTCGEKTDKRSVAPTEKLVLKGFSGCTLVLGEQSEVLHTEMVCTIAAGGKLTCDLL
jgi:hypothetical protein